MKAVIASPGEKETRRFFALLGQVNAELRDLHELNIEADKTIEKLLDSNRKALERIRQNVSYVEANL